MVGTIEWALVKTKRKARKNMYVSQHFKKYMWDDPATILYRLEKTQGNI